ncbi:cupredoxin domain-containing protein [Roseateles sp. BYS180W]|uniref:Cupredoxin domain-containing protein n=1 Tax=Roseateles rivi TaxID=3299028 RepID=A0ABW7FSL3_9BURK
MTHSCNTQDALRFASVRRLLPLALLLALGLSPLPSLAHGGDTHSPRPSAAAEQMPWGMAGTAQANTRTIDIRMQDRMRFTPQKLRVREGETVRLRVHNDGQLMHEIVLGTRATLDEHALQMEKFPDMEHDAPYMAHVPPGQSQDIVWTFNRAGNFEFACLIAGHYQAGMRGSISVQPKPL